MTWDRISGALRPSQRVRFSDPGEVTPRARGSTRIRARRRLDPVLAAALVDARRAAGLTQLQLAAAAGVSVSTIRKLERSERSPSRYTVNHLTDALKLSGELRQQLLDAAAGNRSKRRRSVLDAVRLRVMKERARRARRRGERQQIGGRPGRTARRGLTWRQLRWRKQK